MPDGWCWCTISDICSKIGSGSTPRGSNYAEAGIPFFRSQNVYNDGLVYEDIKYIAEDVHKSMIGTEVLPKDLLLNITGGSLGRCAIVPNDFERGNVSQHVCILRTVQILPEYLHCFIISDYFSETMILSGSGREGLPKYSLEAMMLPIPPLSEQRRIVTSIGRWLSIADILDDNTERVSEAVESAKAKILDLAIHGKLVSQDLTDEPASELLKRINPNAVVSCDNPHYEHVPFDIPDSWAWVKLEDINVFKSKSVNPFDNPTETYELYSVPTFETGEPEFPFGKDIASSKVVVSDGDVLLCKINPHLNRVWVVRQRKPQLKTLASSEWIVIRVNEMLPEYLELAMRSPYFRELMQRNVSGVGGSLMRAQPTFVKQYMVPVPPIQEQTVIVKRIQETFHMLDSIGESLC